MQSEIKAIRVLIADDHAVVREGLAAVIARERDMTVAGEAADGKAAVEAFRRLHPDVALLDLRMPALDGIGAVRAIRGEFPGARLIILTVCEGEMDILRAVKAGAKAYLLKDAPLEELTRTIRAVYEGKFRLPPEIAARIAAHAAFLELTPREIEVLRLLAMGHSNGEIARSLGVEIVTVKSHVRHLIAKLGAKNRSEAAYTAVRKGYVHLE